MLEAHFSSCVPLALVHVHEATDLPGATAQIELLLSRAQLLRCLQQLWKLLPRAFAILQYAIPMKLAFLGNSPHSPDANEWLCFSITSPSTAQRH